MKSKSSLSKRTGLQKILLSLHKTDPSIIVKALPVQDSHSNTSLTGFAIHDRDNPENILETFYADDIVQQRNFIAALGGSGPGIFTNHPGNIDKTAGNQNNDGNRRPSPQEFSNTSSCLDNGVMTYSSWLFSNKSSNVQLPTYDSLVQHLPDEFYQFGSSGIIKHVNSYTSSGSVLPQYIPGSRNLAPAAIKMHSDSFLPPHGPAIVRLVSVGYGKEVGLSEGQQVLWDPSLDCYHLLDHSVKQVLSGEAQRIQPTDSRDSRQEELICPRQPGAHLLASYEVCKERAAVETAANRAARKIQKFIMRGRGHNGVSGSTGKAGEGGLRGADGIIGVSNDGGDGEKGAIGMEGERGVDGRSGSSGADLVIHVSGVPSKLQVNVNNSCSKFVRFGSEEKGVVLVDCCGGDGGEGGCGGEGGPGGRGGDGGKGGDGGSKGGHGGDGGPGERGGDGGNGGDAGSGGCCVVKTTDPSLLMLIELDCTAGVAGKGGSGGAGGKGGVRGIGGGSGFVESPADTKNSSGNRTADKGAKGKPGSTGSRGCPGREGNDGGSGQHGGLLWVVEDPSGKVLHRSGFKYDVVVTSLSVSSPAGGISYEPNEAVLISSVVVKNCGGLPLPQGAEVSFPTNKTVRFESVTYELPAILPGESFTVPIQFHGRIFDQSSPNLPGSFSGQALVSPLVQLLGRPFASSFLKTLEVSYPMKLTYALSKRNIGVGEEATLEVGIENLSSSLTFGRSQGSCGTVKVLLHLDSFLVPLGVSCSANEKKSSCEVSYDSATPDSLWVDISELRPLEVASFGIAFEVASSAHLCDTSIWQADLFYRGKLVQYMSQEVRITPAYSLPASKPTLGDMLLVTSKNISAAEFNLWLRIFDILELNVDFWDSEWESDNLAAHGANEGSGTSGLFGGQHLKVSASSVKSDCSSVFAAYSGKTIVYPYCDLENISPQDIISHFDSSPTNSSGLLLFLKSTIPESFEYHCYDHVDHTTVFRHLCRVEDRVKIEEKLNVGHHLVAPGTFVSADVSAEKFKKKMLKKLEKTYQPYAVAVFSRSSRIVQKSAIKYSYGSMDICKFPIRRSCNFQCVSGAGGTLAAMGIDDPFLTPKSEEFPLASKFGQVLLAVLASAPFETKLRIMKNTGKDHPQASVKCYLPGGRYLTVKELAAIAIAHDVADEILDCSSSISRMKLLKEDLSHNMLFYSRNGLAPVVNQMLSLIKSEAADRVKVCDNVAGSQSSAREITRLCSFLRVADCRDIGRNSDWDPRSFVSRPVVTKMNSLPIFQQHPNEQATASSSRSQSCSAMPAAEGKRAMGKVQVQVSGAGEGDDGRWPLPPLKTLQDTVHVRRSHQLKVKDGCYDVSRTCCH